MKALFGPAGNAESFAAAGYRATVDAPAWLARMGLTAYEYQCGRGVRVGTDTARMIGQAARENGITLSLHAPYFINLSTDTEEQREKNARYVLESCRAAQDMGADRIVVHTGGLGKRSREEAMENSRYNVRGLLRFLWRQFTAMFAEVIEIFTGHGLVFKQIFRRRYELISVRVKQPLTALLRLVEYPFHFLVNYAGCLLRVALRLAKVPTNKDAVFA